MVDDEQKRRIEAQASSLLLHASQLGEDATEALASLYAASQVIERELLARGHLDLRQVAHCQLIGKRLGAAMTVNVEEEVIDPTIN